MLHPPKQDVVLKVFAENKYFISQKGNCVQVLHAIEGNKLARERN